MTDVWGDLAAWFWIGLVLAGIITVVIPDEILTRHLGGGLSAMVLMLVAGIPVYICATASTPIAAALVLKGVSPGAALVFLLAGPATNIAALTLIAGVLGRRATLIYLGTISCLAIVAPPVCVQRGRLRPSCCPGGRSKTCWRKVTAALFA